MNTVSLETVLISLESGSRPKGGVSNDSGEIPSLGGEHINNDGGFKFTNLKRIPRSFYNKMKVGLVQTNDILVVKDGATTGKTSFVRDDFPFKEASINEHIFCVRVNPSKAFPLYVYQFLYSDVGQNSIQLDFRGATVGGISREFVKKTHLPLPPLAEQKRIAEILDRTQSLISKRKEAIDKLDTLTQSIFLEMFGDPVENPKKWSWSNLADICSEIYRYPTFYGFEYQDTGTPVARIGNILLDGRLDPDISNYVLIDPEISKQFPRTILELHDIVMAVRGDGSTAKRIGLVISESLVNANISPNLLRFKAKDNVSHPLFLFNFMVSEVGQRVLDGYITRTAKKTITAEVIKKIKIPLPPFELQKEFAKRVEAVEKLKVTHRASLSQLEALFASLQHRAFRGEL